MLRIIVEIVPGGDESRKRETARAHIANISNLASLSDYAVWMRENGNPVAGAPAWEAYGKILQHDRRQTVWALVERAATVAAAGARR